MLLRLTLACSASLLGCAGSSLAQDPPVPQPAIEEKDVHQPFEEILRAHVRDERVDYLAIRDLELLKLRLYLDAMAKVDPATLQVNDRLAFYLNLYNATMIHTVCDRFVAGWTPAVDDFAVFEEPLVRLRGDRVTLNHVENGIIRPQFNDPRFHAALVCAARSCPPILPRAYRGEDLDAMLEAKMRAFVNDSSRNKLDGKKLGLSKLFEWYGEDFGEDQQAILRYVSRYAGKDLTRREFGTIEYSWALNILPPRGRWVVLKSDQTLVFDDGQRVGLGAGEVVEVVLGEGEELRVREPKGDREGSLPAEVVEAFEPAG